MWNCQAEHCFAMRDVAGRHLLLAAAGFAGLLVLMGAAAQYGARWAHTCAVCDKKAGTHLIKMHHIHDMALLEWLSSGTIQQRGCTCEGSQQHLILATDARQRLQAGPGECQPEEPGHGHQDQPSWGVRLGASKCDSLAAQRGGCAGACTAPTGACSAKL